MEEPSLKNLTDINFGKPTETTNQLLQNLGEPHITSFNYMLREGLSSVIEGLSPIKFALTNGDIVTLKINNASIGTPTVPPSTIGVRDVRIYPKECRQRGVTYNGRLIISVAWSINGIPQQNFERDLGDIPIMVKSINCHLNKMTPKELVEHGEHPDEWGGYFIVKGNEKIIRMLLMTRRNYPIAVQRNGWKSRGNLFSDRGILIRCVKKDQSVSNNVLHYLTDGTAKLMLAYRKYLYYVPLVLVLKCLCDCSDQYIYQKLIQGYEDDLHYAGKIEHMLRLIHNQNLHTHEDCKKYFGNLFKVKVIELFEQASDSEVTDFLLKHSILSHVDSHEDKFNTLVFMTQKLFVFAKDHCKVEGVDAIMMQELLLGGHLYQQVITDKLQMWLKYLKFNIQRKFKNNSLTISDVINASKQLNVDKVIENFLATGSVTSASGLGLMQDKGLVIMAENINRMRYMSHFRAVHRGAFFQKMRTTEARQLLPDAWGFICPVHTPDGAPCGLLNHLTMNCKVVDVPDKTIADNLPFVLTSMGMIPLHLSSTVNFQKSYTTILDGKVVGYVSTNIAGQFVDKLRMKKIFGVEVPETLEIVLVPMKDVVGQYPGLFLFTSPARLMRPVINLAAQKIELIGTFEQVYLNICITAEEAYDGITTHMELSKTSFLSNLAQLIPMPDCNQSPRNMYQCQMGKQTMGTPLYTWNMQADNKLYRLQTPASPLFRPVHHDNIGLDNYPMGSNAIVAVISYTGYDMEDAMILNKSTYERGFAHGCIYKSEFIELTTVDSYFCRNPAVEEISDKLDNDGLPHPGAKLTLNDPYYCFYDADECKYILKRYLGKEDAIVDNVKQCGYLGSKSAKVACIVLRITRNPSVGDKFASRAGQKGICSQKWPAEDLPFTETGIVPDIVFNPHGFPSRMTIAMMIEIMAGKSAALHGLVHDASPFKFNEEDTAIDYFGKLLEAGGYNYYGTETMYSGVDGREMTAQIFFGVVHYQRLRHMVSDKWQVRSTGPIDTLTRQPIKGRKKGGGIRFGEMERDSLISHGTSFLLQDRLFHCSDKVMTSICTSCGSLLSPITIVTRLADQASLSETKDICRLCEHGENISVIEIPYIFKYFVTQLASININVKIDCKKI